MKWQNKKRKQQRHRKTGDSREIKKNPARNLRLNKARAVAAILDTRLANRSLWQSLAEQVGLPFKNQRKHNDKIIELLIMIIERDSDPSPFIRECLSGISQNDHRIACYLADLARVS